jgi:RNA polymerase sigma factor (sigma-70 family)
MFEKKHRILTTLSDKELLEKYIASQETRYFGELFKRHAYMVLGTCKKLLHDREEAKDAAMNVFEHAMKIVKDSTIDNFSGWIYVVARNYCLMVMRKNKQIRHLDLQDMIEEVQPLLPAAEDEWQKEEHLLLLGGCIDRLNELQKRCVAMFYLKEKSYQQIAETMGFSPGQVKSYLQNGKRNLKICMERKAQDGKLQ